MHVQIELGSLIGAVVLLIGGIVGATRLLIENAFSRWVEKLDKRFQNKELAEREHEEVNRRLGNLEQRRSI